MHAASGRHLGTRFAALLRMQPHVIDRTGKTLSKVSRKNSAQKSKPANDPNLSQSIHDEVNAYIAIRDLRVAAAERAATVENLRQAALANDFVETCLKPPQAVYAAQHLAEPDAAFERKRCAVVKTRIAELRAGCVS